MGRAYCRRDRRREMRKLRGCPRCKGDTFTDRDQYSWYEWCLQCGYRRDLEDITGAVPVKVGDDGNAEAGDNRMRRPSANGN